MTANSSKPAKPETLERQFEELFYEAFTEDRDAEANLDPQTLGERCRKYAKLAAAFYAHQEALDAAKRQGEADCNVTEDHLERARIIMGRSDNPLFIAQLLANFDGCQAALRGAARGDETGLREALEHIIAVASGEKQVANDDTEGMAYIDRYARGALSQAAPATSEEPTAQWPNTWCICGAAKTGKPHSEHCQRRARRVADQGEKL